MRLSLTEIERRTEQAAHAWKLSCPGQSFAEMTLEQFTQELQTFQDAKARFAAAEAQWQTTRQERNAAYTKAMDLLKCVANSVKGHPKFGENSALYAAMGYVTRSERSSGLTRRREAETPKEAADAS
jgi:ferric-dicitrate binding protein FerR (iron transport regulator)